MKDVIGRSRLVIILLAVSVLTAGCTINFGGGGSRKKYKKTVNLQAPLAAGSTLKANTSFGNITATGSEVADCNVIATICGQAPTKEEAKEIVEQVMLTLEMSGGRMKIKADKPRLKNNRSIGITYKISLPLTSSLNFGTSYGNIKIENIEGNIDAKSSFGSINCKNVAGDIKLNTSYGNVKCGKIASKNLNIHTSFGSVKAVYLDKAGGDINAKLNTSYGSVELITPNAFAGNVDLSASYGSIKTDLPITIVGKIRKDKVTGSVGNGKGSISAHSSFGSINIK
jgi:DUF4097 and DUF4098 domain-containing protein YvlB